MWHPGKLRGRPDFLKPLRMEDEWKMTDKWVVKDTSIDG